MANILETLAIKLVGDVDDFTKKMGEAENRVDSFGDRMRQTGTKIAGMGALLTASVTAPIILMGNKAVDAASDLEESINKVNVVFGESAAEIQDWASNSAEAFGLSRQEALEAVGTFGNLFTAMGIGAGASGDMSTELIELAGDLASFNNMDPTEVLEKLRSGLVGETEPLRALGVNLTAATVEAKALEMGLVPLTTNMGDVTAATLALEKAQKTAEDALAEHGAASLEYRTAAQKVTEAEEDLADALAGSSGELTAAQKAQAAYALILEQTGTAQGDFARTSDGLSNQQRILSAQWKDMQAAIGEHLLPMKLKMVGVLSDLIDRFTSLSPEVMKTVVQIAAFAAVIGPLLIAVGTFIAVLPMMGTALAALFSPVALIIGAVVALAAAWYLNMGGLRDATQPLIDGVLAVVEVVKEFMDGNITALEAVTQIWQLIKTAFTETFDNLVALVQENLPIWKAQLLEWGRALWQWIVEVTPVVIAKLKEWFEALKTWVIAQLPAWKAQWLEWGRALWQWIVEVTPVVIAKLKEWFEALKTWVIAQLPAWKAQLAEWGRGLWQWIVDATPIVVEKLREWGVAILSIMPVVATLRFAWEENWFGIQDTFSTVMDYLQERFGPLLDVIRLFTDDALGELVSWVQGNETEFTALGYIWETAKEVLRRLFEDFMSMIRTNLPIWRDRLLEWGTAAWQWIVDFTPIALAKIGEWWGMLRDWFTSNLPGWMAKLKEWGTMAWQWIVDFTPIALAKIGEWTGAVIKWLGDQLPVFLATMYKWATELVKWIGDSLPEAIRSFTEWATGIQMWGETTGDNKLQEMVATWVGTLIDWVATDLIPKVVPAMLKFAGEMVVALAKIGLALAEGVLLLAGSIIAGLVEGIIRGVGAVGEAIKRMLLDAIGLGGQALEARSPSMLTKRKWGIPADQGFGVGTLEGLETAKRNISARLNSMVGEISPQFSLNVAGAGAGGLRSVTVTNNFYGQVDRQQVAAGVQDGLFRAGLRQVGMR